MRLYFSTIPIPPQILCEFCFKTNYKLFIINLIAPFRSFAVVINPIELFKLPNKIKVDPNLF